MESGSQARGEHVDEPTGRGPERSLVMVATVGIGVAAVLFLIVASLLTIPLFALARFTEPAHGTDRPWFWSGLRWAVVGGAVVAVASAVALAWWLRRGGRLPEAPRPWEVE